MKLPMILLILGVLFMATTNIVSAGKSCRDVYRCDDDETCWNGVCVVKDRYASRRHQLNDDLYGGYGRRSGSSGRSSGYARKSSSRRSGTSGSSGNGGYVRETVSKKVSGSSGRRSMGDSFERF